MTSGPIACPYCNSQVPLARPLPANGRLNCPRCGEAFPYRGAEPETAVTESPAPEVPPLGALTQTPAPTPLTDRRWSNRAVAGTILAVMGAMAAITLTGAKLTEYIRRAHDLMRPERRPRLSIPVVLVIGLLVYFGFLIVHFLHVLRDPSAERPRIQRAAIATGLKILTGLAIVCGLLVLFLRLVAPPSPSRLNLKPPPVRVVAPAELEGLGYLPAGTNAVMAIHVAQAMRTPAGRAFLDRSQLANSGVGVAQVQESTGLSREQIDHVVLGIRLDDNLLPAPVLVVRTRQPIDAGKIRSALRARRRPDSGKKETYDFELPRLKLNALLWCPTDRILVVTIARKVMEDLPLTPDAGAERLVPPLRDFLKQRLPAGVDSWAVGHWNDGDTAPILLSTFLPADDRKFLASVRTFGFWLRIDESIDLNAAMECADAAGARALAERLKQRGKDGADFLKVLGAGERGDLVSRELARTLRLEQKEKWVTLEATADAKTVRKAVEGQ